MDIYTNLLWKYPLNKSEYNKVEEVWQFLEHFNDGYELLSEYRHNVITKIRKLYTSNEFLEYEDILNKMYWNLRWVIYPIWMNMNISRDEYYQFIKNNYEGNKFIPSCLTMCEEDTFVDDYDLYDKLHNNAIYENSYYRSFINKLILVDYDEKKIITKQMEGSADIFRKNYFNLYTFKILFDRDLYEKIMSDPYNIVKMKIDMPKFYYQYDYGFPNLSSATYMYGGKDYRLNRINKMYYYNNLNKKEKYWFKIIR